MNMYKKEKFMKNKKSIQVSPYALADVIEALTNDSEHFVDIVVTKEDGHLIVMFNRTHKSCSGLSEGLLDKATAKEDKPDHCPMQGNLDLCDNTTKYDITTSTNEINPNVKTKQSCKALYW